MWIFTPSSMVSIVAHRDDPDALLVRARFKGDLEAMFPGAPVTRTPDADYLYRAKVPRCRVASILSQHAERMTYGNVKGAIAPGDVRRKDAMGEVWEAMYAAQHAAEPFARADGAALRRGPERDPPPIFTEALFQHTTARGEPCTVYVEQVQERLEDEPLVSLKYSPSGKRLSVPLSRAEAWLRDAELVP